MRDTVADTVERLLQPFVHSWGINCLDFKILEQAPNFEMQDFEDGKVLHQRVQLMKIAPDQMESGKNPQDFIKDSLAQLPHDWIVD